MAIEKLNKIIKNKGEAGYEQTPVNKKLLQDMCNKTDEIIEEIETKMIRVFSGSLKEGETADVSQNLNDARLLLFRPGGGITMVVAPIFSGQARGSGTYTNATFLEIFSVMGVIQNSGKSFKLNSVGHYNMKIGGIEKGTTDTVTEIWMIK